MHPQLFIYLSSTSVPATHFSKSRKSSHEHFQHFFKHLSRFWYCFFIPKNRFFLGKIASWCTLVCTFPSKNFFERKIFNSVVGIFFLFLELSMTRRVQVCRVDVLSNTDVGSHRCSKTGGGGFKSLNRPFLTSFYILVNTFFFLSTKIQVFLTKSRRFLVNGLFFSQNDPFSDVTETNGSFSKLFRNLGTTFGFSWINRKTSS